METYKLEHPITDPTTKEAITEITLRRPKVKDVKLAVKASAPDDQVEQSIHLLSYIAGVSTATIEELDMVDFAALSESLGKFLGQ